MSESVKVPFGKNPSRTATLLLGTATELGFDVADVRTGTGFFLVPKEVYDEAFNKTEADDKPAAEKKTRTRRTKAPAQNQEK